MIFGSKTEESSNIFTTNVPYLHQHSNNLVLKPHTNPTTRNASSRNQTTRSKTNPKENIPSEITRNGINSRNEITQNPTFEIKENTRNEIFTNLITRNVRITDQNEIIRTEKTQNEISSNATTRSKTSSNETTRNKNSQKHYDDIVTYVFGNKPESCTEEMETKRPDSEFRGVKDALSTSSTRLLGSFDSTPSRNQRSEKENDSYTSGLKKEENTTNEYDSVGPSLWLKSQSQQLLSIERRLNYFSSGDERTYDEPCIEDLDLHIEEDTLDLPRSRSWLCCPRRNKSSISSKSLKSFLDSEDQGGFAESAVKLLQNEESCNLVQHERLEHQLLMQSQRYEEQITELHSVIAELQRKLTQNRQIKIEEEEDEEHDVVSCFGGSETDGGVSEMTTEPTYEDGVLFQTSQNQTETESPTELPEPKEDEEGMFENAMGTLCIKDSFDQDGNVTSPKISNLENIFILQNRQFSYGKQYDDGETSQLVQSKMNIAAVHMNTSINQLVNSNQLTQATSRSKSERNTLSKVEMGGVSEMEYTRIAEHIYQAELNRMEAKVGNCKARNTVLQCTLNELKQNLDRLTLLCGKYESNAIALKLALCVSDRAIEIYDVLLALLETELSLDPNKPASVENRRAAEQVALQLLSRLDSQQHSDGLLLNHDLFANKHNSCDLEWSHNEEIRLRDHVSLLKQQRSQIEGTVVQLEPLTSPPVDKQPSDTSNKCDLETAVFIQEVTSLREEKAELLARVYQLEREKLCNEMRMSVMEKQQTDTHTNLQTLLQTIESIHTNKDEASECRCSNMETIIKHITNSIKCDENNS